MLFNEWFLNHGREMQNRIVAYKYELGDFTPVSCEEFHSDCRRSEAFWADITGDKRCRIAVVAENSYTYLTQIFGIILSGNIVMPMNQNMSCDLLHGFIKELEADYLLADEDCVEELEDYVKESHTKMINITDAYKNLSDRITPSKTVGKDELSLILLSSGTSGKNKAVMISQKNLTVTCERFTFEKKNNQQTVIQVVPCYHIGGINLSMEELSMGNILFISSAKYYMMHFTRFDFQKMLLVPAMAQNLFKKAVESEVIDKNLHALEEMLCVGAPLKTETYKKMQEYGIRTTVYYGLTEAVGTISGDGDYREGACGKICPHNEVRIENDEILVRGANITCGYLNNEAATKDLLRDGWMHTGDLGKIDEDGYLYIIGRSKNIIILSNGENVSPEELEEKLYECSDIEETIVFGKEDTICAKIYCGTELSEEKEQSVRDFVRSLNKTLPTTKKIKEIIFTKEELPKSGVGKIKR